MHTKLGPICGKHHKKKGRCCSRKTNRNGACKRLYTVVISENKVTGKRKRNTPDTKEVYCSGDFCSRLACDDVPCLQSKRQCDIANANIPNAWGKYRCQVGIIREETDNLIL
mmetsp:Transcript_56048/g.167780  ORF Transcript_56048/g.167780 Transcript_56048/m.167780 type:complete len:112 (-) Transcript_56048:2886-3221(-)